MAKHCRICGEPLSEPQQLDEPTRLEDRRQVVASRSVRNSRLSKVAFARWGCPVVEVEPGRWVPRRLAPVDDAA